jgi:GntR family transcriptional regulator/MocR family aminotransferase
VASAKQTNTGVSAFPADLLVDLNQAPRRGLRQTLERALRDQIHAGLLTAGGPLPPSRTLAAELGVSRSVVVHAYANLVADGYLQARQGDGTRVRADARARPPAGIGADDARAFFGPARHASLLRARVPMRLLGGLPDPALFPRARWARHYRAALAEMPDREITYPDPRGTQALRLALSTYLGRVRGVVVEPDRMIVSSGVMQGISLVCRALAHGGARRIAVEEPCFRPHRLAISTAGLQPVPVPVDSQGLDVAALGEHDVDAVLLTPAHSFPTGVTLALSRRHALVSWARDRDALIIEDDYDSELRYDRAPIGALQGTVPERTIYLGSISKSLTPAMRLGWVVVPAHLTPALERQKSLDDMGSSVIEQHALGRLLDSGDYARHLRRVRLIYRNRRDAALAAIADLLPQAAVQGEAAGLHVYATLPASTDVQALGLAAAARGLLIEDAAQHWARPQNAAPAIVFGYGSQSQASFQGALTILAQVLSGQAPRT